MQGTNMGAIEGDRSGGKLIERWILQEMDEGTIEGVMDGCKR